MDISLHPEMTRTSPQQPFALIFADDRPTSIDNDLYQWSLDADDLICSQYARIVELEDVADMAIKRIKELEAQLAQRFDAADMATASAQGFRDGVAKGQQAMWRHIETAPKDGQAILVTDGMDCYCVEWDEEFDWWTVDDNKLGPFRLRGSAPTHWMPLPAAPGPADGESNV